MYSRRPLYRLYRRYLSQRLKKGDDFLHKMSRYSELKISDKIFRLNFYRFIFSQQKSLLICCSNYKCTNLLLFSYFLLKLLSFFDLQNWILIFFSLNLEFYKIYSSLNEFNEIRLWNRFRVYFFFLYISLKCTACNAQLMKCSFHINYY